MEPILLRIPGPERLSDDWLYEFCGANRELRIERDKDGQIIIMAPVGALGSSFNNTIGSLLWLWNQELKSGITFDSSAGFRLPDKSMRSPDAAWIRNSRWTTISLDEQKKFAPITPDFVIEVRSESDLLNELKDKMKEWIENGCQLAWLIDPLEQKAYIFKPRPSSVEEITSFNQVMKATHVVPGFSLDLAKLKS